jgi:cation:H+ antiporter
MLINSIILFILGTLILLVSTQTFIKQAEKLSKIIKLSPLIIGLTVVALGTSFPELSVSTISALRQDTGLALGNIIGSNIVNIFLVLAVGILVGKLRIGTSKTQRNGILLIILTFLFIILQKIDLPGIYVGLALFILAISFTVLEYKWGVFGRVHEDKMYISTINYKFKFKHLIVMIFSLIGVCSGGLLLVSSVEYISFISGISTTFLGLTLTATVTSLPELFATITSQRDDEGKMTIGNIIGSNIYNLLFIGGIVSLVSQSSFIPLREVVFLSVSTIVFALIIKIYSGKVVPKWVGILLISFFLIYLYSLTLK